MRFRTTALVAAAALALAPVLAGATSPAAATAAVSSCATLSSGQVDPSGTPRAVAAIAPAGHLVTGYCVQAGSAAPVYVDLAAPVTWTVIRGAAGIAHYSYAWVATDSTEVVEPGQEPSVPDEAPELPSTPAPALNPWDWNWTYAAPTCDALTVRYPANIPAGQSNDVNIRFNSNLGRTTFNYHNNEGTWSGTTSFPYAQHPAYPTSGLRWFTVEWIQVAGTNYHWQGALNCLVGSDGKAETVDAPQAVTSISGFNTSTVKVRVGTTVAADTVVLANVDLSAVVLQRWTSGRWAAVKTVAKVDGAIKVTFPRETRPGTVTYRLAAPDTDFVTGAVTKNLVVKVVKAPKKKRR
ncbi:hypothetical protein [Nocardioides lianchengensis]|uniref:Ig-like domain (Group 3) n=1 Tax=Nocardioides lianchengensis TaxID=1045774 RepID=A0A1G6UUG7_9ACTN|nr:hypothetical protein [Nocardioides lianchengensis]NYG11023.1 hypothetical protein [Nocardioides lianchengensis]SDD44227.1 hypothetical protein SAMN05421872_10876 [Nocardioides lianchengensis]